MDMDHQLAISSRKIYDPIERATNCIKIVKCNYARLQELIPDYKFNDIDEEIRFFKECKPRFSRVFYFHSKLIKMYHAKSYMTLTLYKKFIKTELHKIETFYITNDHLIQSYVKKITSFDTYYFTKAELNNMAISSTALLFNTNNDITNGDLTIGKHLAFIDLHPIYEKELSIADGDFSKDLPNTIIDHDVSWTSKKSDLIELLYALHYNSSINDGKIDLKQLVKHFELALNIELGDPYRLFAAIKQRKKSPSSYLESLIENFKKRLEEDLNDDEFDTF